MAQTLQNKPVIVDEVSGWLKVYSDRTVDRSWTGPPEFKFMSDPVPPHHHFIDGIATKDVVVDASSGLKLRIYLPEPANPESGEIPKMPLLLHFHGGGFCISEADWFMYYAVYSRMARELRAVVVSVYLRRAPEHRLPAPCEDAVAALRWLSSAGEEWLGGGRVDLGRVFLIGDSSGANIVHYVAAAAGAGGGFGPVRIAGAIPVHPGFARKERSRSEMEMPETPFLTLAMVDKFLSLALPVGATKDHPITCPMGEAAPPLEGLSLPAYLLCVADQDLLKDPQMEFYEAMKKANKDVELFTSGGVGHSFYLNKVAVDMDPTTSDQTLRLFKRIKEFIDEH